MCLSQDLSKKLKGYFSTAWSHLWFPLNGQPNKLKVDKEPFMKQIVTDLDDSKELSPSLTIKLNISHLTLSLGGLTC